MVNPLYISSAPFTFVFKFVMGFLPVSSPFPKNAGPERPFQPAGRRTGFGELCHPLSWQELFGGHPLLRTEIETALIDMGIKGATSLTNGLIAVVIAVPLSLSCIGRSNTPICIKRHFKYK
jgi:hypothetical protein